MNEEVSRDMTGEADGMLEFILNCDILCRLKF